MKATKTFVTGAGGQLGTELARALPAEEAVCASHSQLDVADPAAVMAAVCAVRPRVVIHAAAMTGVDLCEADPDRAHKINTLGAWNVALACRDAGAAMVYVSTNYVFDGTKPSPYLEYDQPNPLGAYGSSKLGGEIAAAHVLRELYVVRTAWVYSPWKRNFVSSLLEAARAGKELRYVADQHASPTAARDLAGAILRLVATGAYGVYHLTSSGSTSWHGWAEAVLLAAGLNHAKLSAIPAAEFKRAAAVPANGVLANTAGASLGVALPDWRESLERYVSSLA